VSSVFALGGSDPDPSPAEPGAAVELAADATPAQRAVIEARLRNLPGVREVSFQDGPAQLAALRADLTDHPGILARLDSIDPEGLPDRLQVTFGTRNALVDFRASAVPAELRRLPGVDLVVMAGSRGATVTDCLTRDREIPDVPGMPSVPRTVRVLLSPSATPAEKEAVRQRLRRVPGATEMTSQSREQTYAHLAERMRQVPEATDLTVQDMPEGWLLTLADRASAERTVDENLDEDVCRMTGVYRVILPPKVV
jgi:cell division protein FtsX